MMDITPFAGPIITAIVTAGSFYGALTTRLARMETLVDELRKETSRHNEVIERTYKLEADVENLYHRYDELRVEHNAITRGVRQ